MNVDVPFIIYLLIITLSLFTGINRHNRIDSASKIIIILLGITLLSEITADFFAREYQNNMPVYHVFNPIELFTISIYYNRSIEYFKKYSIGIYIGVLGVVVGVLNTIFMQDIETLNSYFLLFEGFCIIFMSLFSYRRMFEDVEMNVIRNPHFWFSSIFLFVSGVTYANWALYSFIGDKMIELIPYISTLFVTVGIIAYSSFGLVFLLLPQKAQK